MNGNTFRTLDFESIRALALSFAGSAAGRERLDALQPLTGLEAVRAAIDWTSQSLRVLEKVGSQPYHDLPDIAEFLPSTRVAGAHLEPRALSDAASFIEGAAEISRRVSQVEQAPRLAALARGIVDATPVAGAIRRAILPTGEVADDASPRLAETRRAITRARAHLHSVMESYLRDPENDRLLQDKLVTSRNERYVLLLKAEHRGQIPGIIHGSSGSGASLFVEPMPAVEINNDIVSLQDEERREVIRILRDLTARLGQHADELAVAREALGELDAAQAKALLAREMRATPPEVTSERRLELRQARHPMLMSHLSARIGVPRRSTREVVPISLHVSAQAPVLIISGPNTGGKTVALKTAGLLSLMAQCGFHVPAAEGTVLPVLRAVYADIGDDQSIAENLSTFSAHLGNIVEMTRELPSPALVLLDEVGAGTDPTEGGALGVAVVDYFRRRGAMVLASTHHGLMKAYAQSTPGVAAASFGYDPRSYEPTYELLFGTPGRSLALEMAERLGVPAEIVQDARGRMDTRQVQVEELLKQLEAREATLRAEEERLAAQRAEAEAEAARLRALEEQIQSKKRTELEAFSRELRRRGEEVARRAADAIQKAVQQVEASRRATSTAAARARSEALGEIRRAQEEAVQVPELARPAEAEAPARPLKVGGRARVRALGVIGEVLALHEGEVELAVGGKRLRVPVGGVVALGEAGGRRAELQHSPTPRVQVDRPAPAPREAPAEINIVGHTVDEAMPLVDKALDEAALSDRREVRIIHGFGAGKLRRAVAGLLEGHPHVATFRTGGAGEGGGGVTVVELKD